MFHYRIAEYGSEDFDRWRQIRTQLYLEAGLIEPESVDPSVGAFTDEFDGHSIHLLACDDAGEPVGCCRMIEGGSNTLQVTKTFDLHVPHDSFEVSGTAVHQAFRKTFATLGFYRALFALAEERGYEHAYLVVEEPFLAALEVLGLPVEILTEPRWVYNTYNVVARVRVSAVAAALTAADEARGGTTTFGDYFRRPFTWTLDSRDILPPARAGVGDGA
ncbi:MAG: GNAT family N-acyltransferase [Rhodococcus sp. (in: high G+C Gram-positive bacteria)]|uniref:GNAT family N-acyltransferase n=1 Tax=Rhodococcus sp. TaxID=1831 RepID=UPI003BB5E768